MAFSDIHAVGNYKIRGDRREDEVERTRHRIVDSKKWTSQGDEDLHNGKSETQVGGKQRC